MFPFKKKKTIKKKTNKKKRKVASSTSSGKPAAPSKPVVGWREWVSLPELGGAKIKAKVDTGAKTSSLHAEELTYIGDRRVRFKVYPDQRSRETSTRHRAHLVEHRTVKSSSGHRTRRPVIRTEMILGDMTIPLDITLVDRSEMGFRMLIGRDAIKSKFLVNPGRSFLQGKKKE